MDTVNLLTILLVNVFGVPAQLTKQFSEIFLKGLDAIQDPVVIQLEIAVLIARLNKAINPSEVLEEYLA